MLSGALDVLADSDVADGLGQVPIMAYADLPESVRTWVDDLRPITA